MKCPSCQFENPPGSLYCSKCATALLSPEELSVAQTKTLQTPVKFLASGATFAERYQVIEELGKGGMGRVYKAIDTEIKENVAIKLLNPDISSDEKIIERFRNELKTARKISHKNVCRMYHLSKDKEGTQYITMEFVPGEDLKSTIIRVGQLSAGKAISIAKQVCEGLEEAHGLGVVHRDLKPQNIMVDREGNARIMDFGIARTLRKKGITDAGVIIGTPEYMSPEQVDEKEVGPPADIYSLGVILYEMVTGRVPFEGEKPLSIALKHKSEIVQEPKELNPHIPDDLNRLILKCLEKDSRSRYQSAEELFSALTDIEKGVPVTERIVPTKKPITAREITVKFSLKKLRFPALFILALAITAIVIWQIIPQKQPIPIAPGKPSLAVMYFENNTGDQNFDHWRKALSDLLVADLSQSKYISVLSGERLFNLMEELDLLEAQSYSSKDLKDVSSRSGIEYILVGKMAKAGDTLRINTMLQRARTGELIGSEMVEGTGEESLFTMVDDLTTKIKASFKLSAEEIASDIDEEVGRITTASPEAYKYYREGMKYFNMGDYLKSIPLMETAVAIDNEFAMAFRNMAIAYTNIGYRTEARKRLQKAFELRDRVSERERYYIQGAFYFQSEKTFEKAIETYNELLKFYPEDMIGNNNLVFLYAVLDDWDKAIERYEVNIQNKVEPILSYGNIADAYMVKGLYGKALEILELYVNNISDNARAHRGLAYNFLYQRKYDFALIEANKSVALNPAYYGNFTLQGDIFLFSGELANAEKEYLKLFESDEPRAHDIGMRLLSDLYTLQGRFEESEDMLNRGIELAEMLGETSWKSQFHLHLAYLHLRAGETEKALEACDMALTSAVEAEDISLQTQALHYRGLTYLEMKSVDEARKIADELKELVQKGMNRKRIRRYYHLMGMIWLERENSSKAIEYFKDAVALLPFEHSQDDEHALFIDALASAYYRSGDIEKAQLEFEKIASLTAGRQYWGDIFTQSFYKLAKIYQDKGWKGKAIEQYEQFIKIRKDADQESPEVTDAKNQLTQLQIE
ncbi:MAG: protein kinase [Candidatus Aminicenantes bacterium]|nr:MAG: protein kinase [Candidatus Aminicenantes bacterium]